MAKWDAGVIEANGVEVPVQVDDFSGDWTAEYAGKSLRYETREKLANRLKTLTKQTKIDVEVHVVRITPYTGWGEGKATITRGKLTGLHAGTGNVLADWTVRGKSQKEQIVSYSNRGSIYVGGDTSAEELEKYGKILSELKRLQIEKTAWERKYEIKPKDAVENAIAARGGQDED